MTRLPLLLIAALSTGAHAEWTGSIDEHGLRTASTEGTASFRGIDVPAALALLCRPGENGTVSWEMKIRDSSKLRDFGFDDYEGPDAIALDARRTEIVPEGGMMKTVVKAAPAGWYAEADVFVLGASAKVEEASEVALLADVIGPQTRAVVWTSPSLRGNGDPLIGRFATAGAAALLRATMMGCGPAPAFDAPRFDAALGRKPEASGLWRDRALRWRLEGLLGRDYEPFAARMAGAQPLAKDGDTYFVLSAPTDDGDGAVLMFDAHRVDVVFLDSGRARRVSSSENAHTPPGAVRAFIAAASR